MKYPMNAAGRVREPYDLTFHTEHGDLRLTGDQVFEEIADSEDLMHRMGAVFDILTGRASKRTKKANVVALFESLGAKVEAEWVAPLRRRA